MKLGIDVLMMIRVTGHLQDDGRHDRSSPIIWINK